MRRRVSLGARVSAAIATGLVPFFSCRTVRLFMVAIAPVSHLFPFRTEKLSPDAPMVLPNPRESRSPPFLWIVRSRPSHRPSGPRGTGSFFLRRDGVPSLSSSSPRRWRRTFRAGGGPAYLRFVWPESALVVQVRKEAGLLRYCGRPAFFVYRLCCVARRLSEFVGCEISRR